MEPETNHSDDADWEVISTHSVGSEWSLVSDLTTIATRSATPEKRNGFEQIFEPSAPLRNSPSAEEYSAAVDATAEPAAPNLELCVRLKTDSPSDDDAVNLSDQVYEERMPHRTKGTRMGVATGASLKRQYLPVTRREVGTCYLLRQTAENPFYEISTTLSLSKASPILAAVPDRPTIHQCIITSYRNSASAEQSANKFVESLPSVDTENLRRMFPHDVPSDASDCRVLNWEVSGYRCLYGWSKPADRLHEFLSGHTTPDCTTGSDDECIPSLTMTRKGRTMKCLQRDPHTCVITRPDSAPSRAIQSSRSDTRSATSDCKRSLFLVCDRFVQPKSVLTKSKPSWASSGLNKRVDVKRDVQWDFRHGEFDYDNEDDYGEDPTDEEIIAALKVRSVQASAVSLANKMKQNLMTKGPSSTDQRISQKYYNAAIGKGPLPNPCIELPLDPIRYLGHREAIALSVPHGYALSKYEVVLRTDLAHRFEQAWANLIVDYNKSKATSYSSNCSIDPTKPVVGYYGCPLFEMKSIVRSGFFVGRTTSRSTRKFLSSRICTAVNMRDAINQSWGVENPKRGCPGKRILVCAVLMGRVYREEQGIHYKSVRRECNSHLSDDRRHQVVFSPAQVLPVYVLYVREAEKGPVFDVVSSKAHVTARAAKLLPYGFGEGSRKMVVEEAGSISDEDDEDQAYEYQWQRYEETDLSQRLSAETEVSGMAKR